MKFPKKLLPLGVAFPLCGFLVAASAFAAVPVVGGGAAPPAPGTAGLAPYMVTAGSLDNAGYLACIRTHIKMPGAPNVVANNGVALDCQTTAKN